MTDNQAWVEMIEAQILVFGKVAADPPRGTTQYRQGYKEALEYVIDCLEFVVGDNREGIQ